MAKDDPYYQFPIAMLKGATETKRVCQEIVDYSLWHYGQSLADDSPDQISEWAAIYADQNKRCGFDGDNEDHVVVCAAAYRMGIKLGDCDWSVSNGKRFHEKHGMKGSQCRLRKGLLWDAHNEEWSLFRFRVLCAVIAAIGSRPEVRISRERIRTLAMGYTSKTEATAKAPIMADGTVKHWLNELRKQNIFRVCKCGKFTYYSIRHESNGSLAKSVAAKVCVPDAALPDAMNVDPH